MHTTAAVPARRRIAGELVRARGQRNANWRTYGTAWSDGAGLLVLVAVWQTAHTGLMSQLPVRYAHRDLDTVSQKEYMFIINIMWVLLPCFVIRGTPAHCFTIS